MVFFKVSQLTYEVLLDSFEHNIHCIKEYIVHLVPKEQFMKLVIVGFILKYMSVLYTRRYFVSLITLFKSLAMELAKAFWNIWMIFCFHPLLFR